MVTVVSARSGLLQRIVNLSSRPLQALMKHRTLIDNLVELFLPSDLTHTLTCDADDCRAQHPSHIG